jgi:hypothetical protein
MIVMVLSFWSFKCWRRNSTKYIGRFLDICINIWYFFAGLKYIQEIAQQGSTEIRLDMTSNMNRTGHETCQDFKLTEGTNYTLNIEPCTDVELLCKIFRFI